MFYLLFIIALLKKYIFLIFSDMFIIVSYD